MTTVNLEQCLLCVLRQPPLAGKTSILCVSMHHSYVSVWAAQMQYVALGTGA